MTRPIIGVSLRAHELAAKTSWLCRFYKKSLESAENSTILKNRYLEISNKLKVQCEKHLIEFNTVYKPENLNNAQKLNLNLAILISLSALMISKKLILEIDPLSQTPNLDNSFDCKIFRKEFKSSYQYSEKPFLDVWALFVCGLLTTDVKLRQDIHKGLTLWGEWNSSWIYVKSSKSLKMFSKEGRDVFAVLLDASTLDVIL